jgi:hypothetical protein
LYQIQIGPLGDTGDCLLSWCSHAALAPSLDLQ